MIIIGLEGCKACELIKKSFPDYTYIEIPRLSLGIGDTISKLTNFFGIKTCAKCRLRQYKFNKWIPYTWRIKNINPYTIQAKEFAYKKGITQFPFFTSDDSITTIK